jgi:hypothetical protein
MSSYAVFYYFIIKGLGVHSILDAKIELASWVGNN